ncbi:MAG: hypothetical protein AzoDbin1_04031 [Azoarcus sp.]|nr:hypothetical protein [Azoarcus sp.]
MLTPQELNGLQRLVSPARLSSYSRYLGTRNAAEAYGAYMWSSAISAAFSPVIQAVEVSLRNTLHESLGSAYGADWFKQWVDQEAAHLVSCRKLRQNQQSEGQRLIEKAQDKIERRDQTERRRNGQGPLPPSYKPAWQSVLAELSFGFWVRFLGRWYWDVNNSTKLWPNHLTTAFPGAPSHMRAVGKLHQAYEKAVDLRNRIHHQEPLWKHHSVATASDAQQHLLVQLRQSLALLDYIGQEKRVALEKYGVVASIEELCARQTFARFTFQPNGSNQLHLRQARKDLRLVAKNTLDNESIWVGSDSTVQLVIRNARRRFF